MLAVVALPGKLTGTVQFHVIEPSDSRVLAHQPSDGPLDLLGNLQSPLRDAVAQLACIIQKALFCSTADRLFLLAALSAAAQDQLVSAVRIGNLPDQNLRLLLSVRYR